MGDAKRARPPTLKDLAREAGVAYIAAGHHATERYGAEAVGRHLAGRFGIRHLHLDIDNPA